MEEAPGESRPSFDKLLTKELRLDRRQWEEAPKRNREAQASTPPDALLEVDCLVSRVDVLGLTTSLTVLKHKFLQRLL